VPPCPQPPPPSPSYILYTQTQPRPSFSHPPSPSSYIAEAEAKGGCLAIPSRLRVTGPCSMALMLCPPVPTDCARIVINASKGFVFTLHIAPAGGGGEALVCSDGTRSSSGGSAHQPTLSIDSSRSCGIRPWA
jgi:hypothetical protein